MSIIEVNLAKPEGSPDRIVIREMTNDERIAYDARVSAQQQIDIDVQRETTIKKLTELDIKWLRALREGGEKEPGLLYVDYYANEIVKEREKL